MTFESTWFANHTTQAHDRIILKASVHLSALCQVQATPALLWKPNTKYAKPPWVDNPSCLSGRRTSMTDKICKLEMQLLRFHAPLTTTGMHTLCLNALDSEVQAVLEKSLYFMVHLLKAVDADGVAYYKVGRTRSTCMGQRLWRYQVEMLAVEPRLSLVEVLEIHLLSSEFHAKRFEGRVHRLMLCNKPELLLGARQKTREIYYATALPHLINLFAETAAMSKNDFVNEMSAGALKTSVFSNAAEATPDTTDDEVTEAK